MSRVCWAISRLIEFINYCGPYLFREWLYIVYMCRSIINHRIGIWVPCQCTMSVHMYDICSQCNKWCLSELCSVELINNHPKTPPIIYPILKKGDFTAATMIEDSDRR